MDAFHTRTSAPVRAEPGRDRSGPFVVTHRTGALDHAGRATDDSLVTAPCPQCGYAVPDACRCPGAAGILGLGASLLFLVSFWWGVALVFRWLWA